MSYCYLAFRTNVLLNLCCPGHLSYYSPNESEPLVMCCSQDLPVLVFLMFCSEGDNTQDAIDVAQQLNGWMNLISKKVCLWILLDETKLFIQF